MRSGIHPDYHPVVYRDRAAGYAFLTRSTATPSATIEWEDGQTYPVVDVEVSSASHPFWTGTARVLDSEGRVEKYLRRYGRATKGAAASTGATGAEGADGVERTDGPATRRSR